MSIDNIKSGLAKYAAVERITGRTPQVDKPASGSSGEDFGQMFNRAIGEVDRLQKQADSNIENVVLGKGQTTAHEAMIALEKADVAFQLMNTIRSKIVSAYQEVMRTQV